MINEMSLKRIIKPMEEKYLLSSLNLVETVFTESEGAEEGKLVRGLVEGNPRNYNPRGFKTSADYGIVAAESVHLPAPQCLMVQELVPGALEYMNGQIEYSFYESLR